MRSTIFASALAFAASALAQTAGFAVMTSPTDGEKVPSGQTFTIKWEAGEYTGPVSITLLGGDTPATLTLGPVLATVDVTQESFAWSVDCSLGKEKTYGLKITSVSDEQTFQYSFPFAISGPSCSSGAGQYPTSSSSSAAVSTSSASSSAVVSTSTCTEESHSTSSKEVSYPTSSFTAPLYPTATSASSTFAHNTTVSSIPSSSSSVSIHFSSAPGNLSYSATPVPTYVPTTVVTSGVAVTPSATTSKPATIPTAAANNVAAGSLALLGGLAVAFLGM
ncbi:Ser-Thr-rich glycosyl-phosphatidyl-inositol-anchored membrane family-domain-containing protein [Hypoxylon sp. FL0890]|nr:Ser-Thr-rich glycosyl-phosphatidyl-inositol-anchored membrane family-domain-containing protein [Hypoxylon sp. FL0890]